MAKSQHNESQPNIEVAANASAIEPIDYPIESDLLDTLIGYYNLYGPRKPMGSTSGDKQKPHFFLHRNFLGEQDLAILFNTKRCRYNCHFCSLPNKSSPTWISGKDVLAQYLYVWSEVKNAIGVIDRITIANEGSVFDTKTFPLEALLDIAHSTRAIPRLNRTVFETRLEFVTDDLLQKLRTIVRAPIIDILTGFETKDERIRDDILGKREPLAGFQNGLDKLAGIGAQITTYVLFKPDYNMTDKQAWEEAEASIDYVAESCEKRGVPFTIRLNPMYVSKGSKWAEECSALSNYLPPRLSDVVALANKKKEQGMNIYLGLTSEGLSSKENTYRGREDFNSTVLKTAIKMNG